MDDLHYTIDDIEKMLQEYDALGKQIADEPKRTPKGWRAIERREGIEFSLGLDAIAMARIIVDHTRGVMPIVPEYRRASPIVIEIDDD